MLAFKDLLAEWVEVVIMNQEYALMKYAVFSYEVPGGSMFPFCLRVFLGIFSQGTMWFWGMRKGQSVSCPHTL